jgi:hypothetical protein
MARLMSYFLPAPPGLALAHCDDTHLYLDILNDFSLRMQCLPKLPPMSGTRKFNIHVYAPGMHALFNCILIVALASV